MKKWILFELLKFFNSQPQFKKKFKIFIIVSSVFVLVMTVIILWASISLFKFGYQKVTTLAHDLKNNQQIETQIQQLKNQQFAPGEILKSTQVQSCWSTLSELTQLQPWLEKSVADHFNSVVQSCLTNPNINEEVQSDSNKI